MSTDNPENTQTLKAIEKLNPTEAFLFLLKKDQSFLEGFLAKHPKKIFEKIDSAIVQMKKKMMAIEAAEKLNRFMTS